MDGHAVKVVENRMHVGEGGDEEGRTGSHMASRWKRLILEQRPLEHASCILSTPSHDLRREMKQKRYFEKRSSRSW